MLDKKKINFSRKRMTTPDKRYRYSIRKFNVGIASVAIAAFMFLGNGAVSVSASELPTTEEAIPSSGPVSEEVLPSSTEITETEPVSSSTPPTETPEETPTALPAQTEKVVTEETVPATENADSLPTNESQQESLSTTESDDALAAAKKVLEEVISEAEVLSADALRKAAKQPEQATALETAANETKAVAETANKVFADEHASLEEVNAQITAIRTSVDSLVREVRNQTGTEDIQVMLTATTATETPADDADKSIVTAISDVYTAKTQKVTSFTSIPDNAIVVIQSEATPTTYTYKRFAGAVNFSTIKTAYDAGGQFVDAATFGKDQVKENETIYVVKEADLKKATSIEESYDLTKFHHREHLLINPNDLSLAALARPGTFSADIKFVNRADYQPSKDFPAENNTILVTELTNKKAYADMSPEEQANYNLKDDGTDQYFYDTAFTHDKYNFFLSHIDGTGERTSKKNSVFDLPPGVVVAFKDANGNPVPDDGSIENKIKIDQIFKKNIDAAYNLDTGELAPSLPMEFKFQVYKDGKLLKEDDSWRSVRLHTKYQVDEPKTFYTDENKRYENFSTLITTKLENTANDFTAGIVDNIDFSELPEPLKNEAVEMERTTPNLDGTLPEDKQLPSFTRPDGKNVKWNLQRKEYLTDGSGRYFVKLIASDNQHGTSPLRVWPNNLEILNGTEKGLSTLRTALKAFHDEPLDITPTHDIAGQPIPADQDWDEATKEKYKSQLTHIYDFFELNMEEDANGGLVDTIAPNGGAWQSIQNYWSSPIVAQPIPTFDLAPADINLEELTIERQTTPKGSVKIVYKALKADGTTVDEAVTLRGDINDKVDAAVGTPWNAKEKGVDHDDDAATAPIDERPATLLTEATPDKASLQYKLVAEKTTVQTPTRDVPVIVIDDSELEGQVAEGLTTITYYYKPVLGGVIVKYVNEAGVEIAAPYTDTDLTTHLTSPVQSYDAAGKKADGQTDEKPLTLTGNDGKSYIFKEVKTGEGLSQPTGNLKEGTTTVVYVYSEKPKGSVLVRYKALDVATGSQEDNSVTLREDYLDTPLSYVDTAWSTVDKNVDHDKNQDTPPVDEQPTKFENINGTNYVLVKTVTQVPRQNTTSEATSGTVVEGQTVVTYFYAPVQTETKPTENKGSVVIEYRRLGDKKPIASAKDDRKDVVVSTTTNTKTFYVVDGQRTYLDGGENGVDTTVATPANQLAYNANETGEQPTTIKFQDTEAGETAEKTYHFVKHDESSADITGSVEAGLTKTVVYLYSPEQTETIPTDNTAKVTVNYYILGTSRPLQPNYEDTPATKISETVTTNTYYLNANGERVPVGTPTVVTNPVDPAETYDTTETKNGKEERPTTLELGGTTYHLVEAATTFTDGTGISGNLTKDTVVNY
ncbi:TPA: YSIRK-type signal peptide-containing protein, partial [Streptococcus suis]